MLMYERLQSSSFNEVATVNVNSQELINGRIHKLYYLDSNNFFTQHAHMLY